MKQISIDMDVVYSQVNGDFPWSKSRNALSYRLDGYQFMPAFRNGWDGRVTFLTKKGRIPTGLVPRYVQFLRELGNYDVKVQCKYTLPPTYSRKNIPRQLVGITPRKYQLEAAYEAVNNRRGVIKLPTAAGKTIIAMLILRTLQQSAVFLTHQKEIMYQTYDKFVTEFGEDNVGLLGDGKARRGHLVTIVMVQTLVKMPPKTLEEFMKSTQVFIGDEIHHAKAKTWKKMIAKCPAKYRIGLTATPEEGGVFMELESATGPVIYTRNVTDLASKGFLSLPEIVMSTISKPKISHRFDYQQSYRAGIVENSYRNARIISICQGLLKYRRGPVLVFSTTLEHLSRLMELAHKKELNYNVLTGSDSSVIRKCAIDKMMAGKLDVLFVSTIFDEGVDIPNVGSIIMAGVGRNKKKLLQRLGRGMRISKGKKKFVVVDFWDDTCQYLLKHSKNRRTIYKKEGYDVIVGSLKHYLEDNNGA